MSPPPSPKFNTFLKFCVAHFRYNARNLSGKYARIEFLRLDTRGTAAPIGCVRVLTYTDCSSIFRLL
jgi:hypothetical protein